MGRGSSKAGGGGGNSNNGGGGGGGGNANALPKATNQVVAPTPAQVAKGDITPIGGVPFSDFEQMTDDEKAQVVTDALRTGVPIFLEDSGMQRFAYFTGMSGKPTVVSDDALDKLNGPEIFRTVHSVYDRNKDIGYSGKEILDQISKGDYTMYSDSGGSAYGRAIYFGGSFNSSKSYAHHNGTDQMIRAKITSGRTVKDSSATNIYNSALRSGDKLAKACSRAGGTDGRNLFMLTTGYDAIVPDSGGWSDYHMILNRRCLTVSSTYKDPTKSNSWK